MADSERGEGEDTSATSGGTETAELDPRDELMVVLMVQGLSHSEIAAELGCSTKTIQRRLKDPDFAYEVKARRRAVVHAATARLEGMIAKALDTLSRLLSSEDEHVALKAVQLTLQTGRTFHREDLVDEEVDGRLNALEGLIDRSSEGRR